MIDDLKDVSEDDAKTIINMMVLNIGFDYCRLIKRRFIEYAKPNLFTTLCCVKENPTKTCPVIVSKYATGYEYNLFKVNGIATYLNVLNKMLIASSNGKYMLLTDIYDSHNRKVLIKPHESLYLLKIRLDLS